MTTINALVDRVRLELADLPTPFTQSFLGDGVTTSFQLEQYPVDANLLTVTVNGVYQVGSAYTVDERSGRGAFQVAPAAGASVLMTGTSYRYFSTTDTQTFVNTAFTEHIYNRTDAFGRQITIGNLASIEEYPVALLATIQALYALATDSAFDIDIATPDGVHIPRSERYQQLSSMIATRQQQYMQLCEQLNVGLYQVQVFTLRRVSKMTGRYVPIYIPQEVDDFEKPQRVFLPIPTYGAVPMPQASAIMDIAFTQGDTVSYTLTFGFDITNYTFAAQIRYFPGNPNSVADFTVTKTDLASGTVVLSLTSAQTTDMPLRMSWDLQYTDTVSGSVTTAIAGNVFCTPQVTIT